MSHLQAHNLKKRYGERDVVSNLSLEIHRGEILGLLGPNGAGKTTAFSLLMGMIRPDQGQIVLDQQDITHLPIHKRAQLGIGFLAQEASVIPSLTVEENILTILEYTDVGTERLEPLLAELALTPLRKKRACTLSGGERRRLEITRALVTNPSVLLLDEPFANIDPKSIADVQQLIKMLARKGIAVLITDHNAREIFSIVDRSYIMLDGRVLLSGTPAMLAQNPEAKTHYLGQNFTM